MAAWGARGVWCQEFLGGLGISCKTSLDGKSFASGSSGEFCYVCDPSVVRGCISKFPILVIS